MKKETRSERIVRLMAEAQAGLSCGLSAVDALEFRRDQYNLPRTEFAALLGMSQSHYSEFMNGKRKLPKKAMIRAYAIGVPAEVLLQPET